MSRSTQILRYIIRRLFQAVPIVLAIIVLNFFLLNMAEGDAVDVLAGEAGSATPEYMAELRAKFGLDQPLPVQLLVYLKNIISLDLGYSFRHDMPVSVLIVDRFWPTLLLMVSTIILAVLFGILLGPTVLGWPDDDSGFLHKSPLVSNKWNGKYCCIL